MEKKEVVYLYTMEYYWARKKQGHFAICNNTDGSGGIMPSETGHIEK